MGFKAKKDDKKEDKYMHLVVGGELVGGGYFGKENQHAWFTVQERDSGIKLNFKLFDATDKQKETLEGCDEIDVEFTITYSKDKNGNIVTVLRADELEAV